MVENHGNVLENHETILVPPLNSLSFDVFRGSSCSYLSLGTFIYACPIYFEKHVHVCRWTPCFPFFPAELQKLKHKHLILLASRPPSKMVLLWWRLLYPAKSYQGIACKARSVSGWWRFRSCPHGKDHQCTRMIQVSNMYQPLPPPWPSHVGGFSVCHFPSFLGQ